jgi:Omp85 superfamily domain
MLCALLRARALEIRGASKGRVHPTEPSSVRAPRGAAVSFLLLALLLSRIARADAPDGGAPAPVSAPTPAPAPPVAQGTKGLQHDYWTRRLEPAGFPVIGGNSDIGVQFGAGGTLSYFKDGVVPYRWSMNLVLSLSVKGGSSGTEIAQQSFLWLMDIPDFLHERLRIYPEVSYQHTVNYGYFGFGNASSGTTPANNPNPERYHEWIESYAQVRPVARVRIHEPLYLLFMGQYLHVSPQIYSSSLLAQNASAPQPGQPTVYGATALSLPSLAGGILWDSRNDEIFPQSGMLHEVGARFLQALPFDSDVRYVETGAILRGYLPLVGPLVLAGRLVVDFEVGHVPFYDQFQAGVFDQKEMPGGSAGIRGVPVGRYLGPIKVVGNIELRAMYLKLTVLKQRITLGNDVFFDTGRVWTNYTFNSPLDGSGLGLHFGLGCGFYVLWGEAAMLRIEAAYSPDAVSENPSLPLGIYVEDGTMF